MSQHTAAVTPLLLSCEPFAGASLAVLEGFIRHVNKRFLAHLERHPELDATAVEAAHSLQDRLPTLTVPEALWSTFQPHERLRVQDMLRTLKEIQNRQPLSPDDLFRSSDNAAWLSEAVVHTAATLTDHHGEPPQLTPDAITTEDRGAINIALGVIEAVWPELHVEIASIFNRVVILRGHGLESASYTPTFGVVYISSNHFAPPLALLELLVHECAHYSLYVKDTLAPLLHNPRQPAVSPLRADPRPLIGVLHATFVILRIRMCLARMLSHATFSSRAVHQSLQANRHLLDEGIATLERHAQWTPSGAVFFKDLLRQRVNIAHL